MPEKIFKRTYTVTVLSRESDMREVDTMPDGNDPDFDPFDLLALNYAINEGPWLGQIDSSEWTEVPADQVEHEQLALGNDGSFFEDPDDEEEEEDDDESGTDTVR